ncbi:sialate O-acetylesterase [Agrobacterium sp. Azo12]|uniref:sialate O-acetylesterase n=1 Tax=Agrobacterium sp. Azo12 TaxID=3031129 RepID=UPI0023D7EE34|nr:sialate O-acetylesterase [Agrobacterium sp. Azo12]MDO5895131.1 sialate O-acetylesterase [Agrobacterium sp. Azo12]
MISAGSPKNKLFLDDPRRFIAHPSGSTFFSLQDELRGKTQVPAQLVSGENTAVIVVLGQSNAGNHCGGAHAASSNKVHNFNLQNGGMYLASDPLLGATGPSGCFATFLGDKLIADGRYQRVILAPMSINATLASDWAAAGVFSQNIRVMCRRLAASGLPPTMVLYHQGESDNAEGTSAATITAALRSMVDVFRSEGVTAPVFIALASTWAGYSNNAAVRAGQAAAVNGGLGIYQGPDTDTIGPAYRDSVHFLATGSQMHADLWASTIVSHFGL